MTFRFSDYLFTPRDLAAGWHYLYAQGNAHHFVDGLILIALIAGVRLFDLGSGSLLVLLFLTWKLAIPRFRMHEALDLLTLILCLWLIHYFWDTGEETLFFLVFIAVLFRWRVDSRVSIGAALLCLIAIPISLVLFQIHWWFAGEISAEKIAVWAYYFLAIGVTKQIYEMVTARTEKI